MLALCQGVLMALPFAVKCLECKTVSDTYDPYLDVTLEVEVVLQGWAWGSLLLRGDVPALGLLNLQTQCWQERSTRAPALVLSSLSHRAVPVA